MLGVCLGLIDHGFGFLVSVLLAAFGMGQRLGCTLTQVAGVFQFSSDRAGPRVQAAKHGLECAHASSNQQEYDKRQESGEGDRIGCCIGEAAHETFAMTFSLGKCRKGGQGRQRSQREEVFH